MLRPVLKAIAAPLANTLLAAVPDPTVSVSTTILLVVEVEESEYRICGVAAAAETGARAR